MGLKEQRERIYYDMRGRVAPSSPKYARAILEKDRINGIIKSELREAGLRGKIHMKPTTIDVNALTFDDVHINKERNHNVTLEEAKMFVRKARFSETVWQGRFERYYSKYGVAYVNANNMQIRTAFKGEEIKGVTKKALEVIRKYE